MYIIYTCMHTCGRCAGERERDTHTPMSFVYSTSFRNWDAPAWYQLKWPKDKTWMVPGHQPQRQSPGVPAVFSKRNGGTMHWTDGFLQLIISCYAQAFTHGKVVMFDSNWTQMLYLLPFHCYLHPTLSKLPCISVEWKVSVCDTTDDFRFTTWFPKKSRRTLTTIPDSITSQRFQPPFMREFPKNHHIFQWSSSAQLFEWLRHTLTHLGLSENVPPNPLDYTVIIFPTKINHLKV